MTRTLLKWGRSLRESGTLHLVEVTPAGRLPEQMRVPEVIRLRGLYRLFWEPLVSADVRSLVVKENPQLNKSDGVGGYFQDPEEIRAAIAAKDPKELKAGTCQGSEKAPYRT